MRDPKRIDEMLKLLERAWKSQPDLRLGQLIANATRVVGPSCACHIFQVEDDAMETGIRVLFEIPKKDD